MSTKQQIRILDLALRILRPPSSRVGYVIPQDELLLCVAARTLLREAELVTPEQERK